MDLDLLKPLIAPVYSNTGRPALLQPEIFRALVVMIHCGIHGITDLVQQLRADPVLATICGLSRSQVPAVAGFYAFVDRL